MRLPRENTKTVRIGNLDIGGGHPVAIQSMTSTDTRDLRATLLQIKKLEQAGCEIVRLAVPDREAAAALRDIRRKTDLPLVADIHFDYRLALAALEAGADKLRLNPGNIGNKDRIRQVVMAAKRRKVPIRIGVNAGSLEKDLLEKHGHPTARAMVQSVMRHVKILEELDFTDLVISLKGSDVPMTIEAYRLISGKVRYPLHLGITEAGTAFAGGIRSAVGIGTLLAEGIGDTIRVSLAGDPVNEIEVARMILQSLKLRTFGPEVIACPTCGRTSIDVAKAAEAIESKVKYLNVPLKIAVMGCAVNGPGEAREADLGLAGGRGQALIFRKGKIVGRVRAGQMVPAIMREIAKMHRNGKLNKR
jgi:(E)-4-hydroxy-3-methylbut-2-enyl-diphosphate synthase